MSSPFKLPSLNQRIVYAYKQPAIHLMIATCIYVQARSYIRKQNEYTQNQSIVFQKWQRFLDVRQQYWERMCDLERKDEFKKWTLFVFHSQYTLFSIIIDSFWNYSNFFSFIIFKFWLWIVYSYSIYSFLCWFRITE